MLAVPSQPTPTIEPLHSREAVCAALGLSMRTLDRRIAQGQVRVVRVGRLVRVPADELARLAREGSR